VYDVFGLSMGDRYRNSIEQSERDEALLVISKAVVLECERRTRKDFSCIDEVDAVVLEVLQPFRLVPLELHLQSVYTARAQRNPTAVQPGAPDSGRSRKAIVPTAGDSIPTGRYAEVRDDRRGSRGSGRYGSPLGRTVIALDSVGDLVVRMLYAIPGLRPMSHSLP
jgi:hypothetical protein